MTTLQLSNVIEADGKTLNSLTLRRAKMGDIRAARRCENEIDAIAVVAARLAGVSIDVIDELDGDDADALFAAVAAALDRFKSK